MTESTATREFIDAVSATTWGALAVVVAAWVIWFAFGRDRSKQLPGAAGQYRMGLGLVAGIGATVVFGSLALTAASSELAAASIAAAIDTTIVERTSVDAVEPTAVAARGDETINSRQDLDLINALVQDFGTIDELAGMNPDCLARAYVVSLGGAARIETEYGLTAQAVEEGPEDFFLLSQSDAVAVADGFFSCGMSAEFREIVVEFFEPSAQQCVSDALDERLIRDVFALEFMAIDAMFEVEAEIEAAFDVEFLRVAELCAADLDNFGLAITDFTDDVADAVADFEALVVPAGFDFVGDAVPEFAHLCLHPGSGMQFLEYERGTTRVSLIASETGGAEAGGFYDYVARGPYDCSEDVLYGFLHVGVDGEFDAEYPYVQTTFQSPLEDVARFEDYLRKGAYVFVVSGLDLAEVDDLRELLRGTGPVG